MSSVDARLAKAIKYLQEENWRMSLVDTRLAEAIKHLQEVGCPHLNEVVQIAYPTQCYCGYPGVKCSLHMERDSTNPS